MLDTTTNWPTGWETEFNLTTLEDSPVDLRETLGAPQFCRGKYARALLDAGCDQGEVNTNPSNRIGEHVEELQWYYEQLRQMNGGMRLHFDPRRRHGTPVTVGDFFKPRHVAMLDALQRQEEGGANGHTVVEAGNINAFHVHFGFGDVRSNEATQAMNLLNAATPAISEWVHQRFGITSTSRNQVWSFARLDRMPAPRWFPDFQTFHNMFESIPRLVKPIRVSDDKPNDQWVVDLETKQVLGDEAAEGTTWWGTRIRPLHDTVEYRPTPTIADPLHCAELVIELSEWLERALTSVGDRQFGSFDEAVQSGFIPAFCDIGMPQSEAAWWQGWDKY